MLWVVEDVELKALAGLVDPTVFCTTAFTGVLASWFGPLLMIFPVLILITLPEDMATAPPASSMTPVASQHTE